MIWTPERIKELKERGGYSAASLSKEIGVGERIIRYWTSGKSQPGNLASAALSKLDTELNCVEKVKNSIAEVQLNQRPLVAKGEK